MLVGADAERLRVQLDVLACDAALCLCLLDGVEGKRHRRDTYKEPDAGNAPSGSNNRRASDAAPRADRGTASPNSLAALSLAE